jgi:hypothetical protein
MDHTFLKTPVECEEQGDEKYYIKEIHKEGLNGTNKRISWEI